MSDTQPSLPQSSRTGRAWLIFDKLGAVGALLSALAAPCCFPLLATIGGVLGLGSVPFLRGNAPILIQVMTALAVVGQIASYRQHRKRGPLVVSALSAGLVGFAYFVSYHVWLIYVALSGLTIAAIWNLMNNRRDRSCCDAPVIRESVLTCPHCRKNSREVMPTDACVFFWDCPGCGTRLKPKLGHCCVFCSYGSVKCPPIQAGSGCPPCNCGS